MIGWLDCSGGVSGDMLLGAMADAGVPLAVLQSAVDAVAPEPVRLHTEPVHRGGLRALRVHVETDTSTTYRTWADVRTLLEAADLDAAVRARSLAVFGRLAVAEAAVHGTAPDDVHFHEVGALDAIADVVAASAGLAHLGLDALHASPVAVGGGSARTAHGELPVPVPAVVELLRGYPSVGGPVDVELATPTGAAVLTASVDPADVGPQPAMAVTTVGVGAGGRDLAGRANVVRLLLGTTVDPTEAAPGFLDHRADSLITAGGEEQLVVETNVDDLDPRLWPHVLGCLLAVGASDAWLTPILMKKGRPAHSLGVLVAADRAEAVRRVVFTETSAIGLREHAVGKHALQRLVQTVDVDGQPVGVKLAMLDGEVVNAAPEHDDVAAAAAALGRPVKAVLAAAVAAAQRLTRAQAR